jgi:hypothetical protein
MFDTLSLRGADRLLYLSNMLRRGVGASRRVGDMQNPQRQTAMAVLEQAQTTQVSCDYWERNQRA